MESTPLEKLKAMVGTMELILKEVTAKPVFMAIGTPKHGFWLSGLDWSTIDAINTQTPKLSYWYQQAGDIIKNEYKEDFLESYNLKDESATSPK